MKIWDTKRGHSLWCTRYLYNSLLILNIEAEKLTHSMRLLAVDPMIKNNDHFKRLCKVLNFLLEEQMERTAMSEK